MNTDRHTVTIPIDDYEKLMAHYKSNGNHVSVEALSKKLKALHNYTADPMFRKFVDELVFALTPPKRL